MCSRGVVRPTFIVFTVACVARALYLRLQVAGIQRAMVGRHIGQGFSEKEVELCAHARGRSKVKARFYLWSWGQSKNTRRMVGVRVKTRQDGWGQSKNSPIKASDQEVSPTREFLL